MREEGRDPSHGGEAARKRGATNARKNRAALAWESENGRPDSEAFRQTILPGLRNIPVKRIRAATGLSLTYCSAIRKGERVPHPQHWAGLATLGN